MVQRVLVLGPFWPEGSGGALATYLIVRLLAGQGDLDVTVATGTREPARINNVKFIVDPMLRAASKLELLLRLANPLARHRYEELIRRFDVLYIPSYSSSGYPLIPIAKRLGKKVVVHLHDYQPFSYNSVIPAEETRRRNSILDSISYEARYEVYEHGSLRRAVLGSLATPITVLLRLWVRQADVIVCVSRRQAEIVAEMAPELRGKIRVIYNPPPEVPPVEKRLGDPLFLYLGGDSYIKGFYVLLEATWQVLKRHPEVRFLLAGGFKDSGKLLLEKLSKRFSGAYNLLGYLEHEDVLKLHGRSYALLFPSIHEEPLPYAVLESMLAGTIPIASRVGGVLEIVKDTPAEEMMFTPGDVYELVDLIELILSMSKEQLIDIGGKLRETVSRRFDNEKIKQELLKIFTM